MKLNVWPFSLSVGAVTAVAFAICAFFVALAPEATAALFSYLLHIDLTGLVRKLTWESFFAGLFGVSITMAIGAAATAWIYNCAAEA